jgi:hypothetical protein
MACTFWYGAVFQGAYAGRLLVRKAVFLPLRQHAQATAAGLPGMASLAQQPFNQDRAERSHGGGPCLQRVRVPVGHFAVRRRHVRRYRRVAPFDGA